MIHLTILSHNHHNFTVSVRNFAILDLRNIKLIDNDERSKIGRDRLEIRMSDSVWNSPKQSDRFDNSETKIQNREICLVAGFMVLSVVYKATGVDHRFKHSFSIVFAKSCNRFDNLKLYLVFGSDFLTDHVVRVNVV